ncbi:peptidoglycan-binding protein [Streptomyces sp. NBC_01197]|uniref:peptidoglycan-binding protein n=1 Tax=Streptomyces sp. NBC_01197 TaxID=2903768 RepID=UPI002E1659F5|nr:peptidoglycan-binding protein [Streptomyces sp. NBC_01197]
MTNANKIISVAKAEVGYHEGKSNGHWNNKEKYAPSVPGLEWADYQAWCATFVSWCALKAGVDNLFPRTASCATGVQWFKSRGQWSEYPAVGAQVFYGSGGGSHTGIVTAYTATTITTVEGNTNTNGSSEGDGVYLKTRPRKDSYVYGYGYPAYSEGLKSADPSYDGRTPPKAPETPSVSRSKVTIGGLEYGYGASGAQVTAVGKALVAKGFGKHYTEGPGPNWSDSDTENYSDYQKSLGYKGKDADGVPGADSLKKLLGALPGDTKAPVAKPSVSLAALTYGATQPRSAELKHPAYKASVTVVQAALVKGKFLKGKYEKGIFDVQTKSAYSAYQRSLGYKGKDANGIPGMVTLKKLASSYGFLAKP